MKRLFAFIMACWIVALSCMGCSTDMEVHNEDEGDFFLSYLPGEPQLKGNKLYIKGLLSNGSPIYDIVDLSGIEIVITDTIGNEQTRIVLNSQFADNCVIAPYGTVEYNISCDTTNFSVQSIWELRYEVVGEYSYIECTGSNCPYCGGQKTNASYPIQESEEPEYTTIKCYTCNGSGICQECNGSGKNDYDGVLAAFGCTLCDKTGKCYKCNGNGYIKIY